MTNRDCVLAAMTTRRLAEILDAEQRGCDQCYARETCWISCADEDCVDVLEEWLEMEVDEVVRGGGKSLKSCAGR